MTIIKTQETSEASRKDSDANLTERFKTESSVTDATHQISSRPRGFSAKQSVDESSTRTEIQTIGIKIKVPPSKKVCDRLLGRQCPPLEKHSDEEQVATIVKPRP